MLIDQFLKDKSSLLLLCAAGILALVANIFFFRYLQKTVINDNYKRFVLESKEHISEIQKRMNYYEMVLRGSRGLFAASKSVERDEWKKYVDDLSAGDQFPGIQAIGFGIHIPKEDLSVHIEQIRQEGFTNYKVWPEGERKEFTSVVFIEPFEGQNLRDFGYDMLSDPVRSKAMELARDHNDVVFSDKVKSVFESDTNVQNGFLMYLPIYKNNLPHGTVEERRINLFGYIYIPFRMDDLIWGILKNNLKDLRLEIYNGKDVLTENVMFDNKRDSSLNELAKYTFSFQKEVPLYHNYWTIRISAVPRVNVGENTLHFVVFYVGGVVISVLLIGLLWSLLNNKKEASRLAEMMTADLKRSEAKFRAMNEASPLGIFMTDPAGKYIYINTVFQNMSGLTLEMISGDGWINNIHPDDRYQVTRQWKAFVEGKTQRYQVVYRYLRKNNTIVWVKVESVQVHSDGQVSGFLGVVEDISEIKLQEGALKESEERASLIIDSALDAIIIIKENNIIVGWNKQAELIFGYQKEEAVGHQLGERIKFIENPIIAKEGFGSFLHQKKDFTFNKRLNMDVIHRDGHTLMIEMSVSFIFINGREHFSLFIRDVTDHRHNEEMIKQRTYTLERMNKLMVDREMKMIELKEEIRKLKDNQNKPTYPV